jgi:hypothetical protein
MPIGAVEAWLVVFESLPTPVLDPSRANWQSSPRAVRVSLTSTISGPGFLPRISPELGAEEVA